MYCTNVLYVIWKSQTLAHTTQNGFKMILQVGQLPPTGILTHTNNTAEPLLDGLQLGRSQDDSLSWSQIGELFDCCNDVW